MTIILPGTRGTGIRSRTSGSNWRCIMRSSTTRSLPYKNDFEGFCKAWEAGEYDPGASYTFRLDQVEALEVLQEEENNIEPDTVKKAVSQAREAGSRSAAGNVPRRKNTATEREGKRMAKKKRKREAQGGKEETPRQTSRQQTNWMTWQLELLNKIQPKVAETVERRNNNGID